MAAKRDAKQRSGVEILLQHSGHRTRRRLQVVTDVTAMGLAVVLAAWFRYDFDIPSGMEGRLLWFTVASGLVFAICGAARGLYSGRWSFGSFEELSALVGAIVMATVALVLGVAVVNIDGARVVPLSVPLIASTIMLAFSAGVRYVWRLFWERHLRPQSDALERVVVVGAGEGGQQIVTAMLRNPAGRYLPVALIDDDPTKRNLRIRGVPVAGTRDDMGAVAAAHDATIALLAIPTADSSLIRDYADIAREHDLRLLVLPSASELYGAQVSTADIRPVTHADLLGRHEVDTDVDSIAGYVTGKRVLVTGAGGSIGSELSRQLYRFAPSSLILLERDESALHSVQLSIEGRALLDSRNLVVCDIRDEDRVRQVFAEHKPEVVFHAAALKHLPLLQMHPAEALKTNVWGTQVLVQAALEHGVERFVNISTDKAADPSSVLGYTKRLAERLTAAAADRGDGVFLSVRFGNVLGSRGSVLTAFAKQIEAGGPVTVTHPDVTRYFMTVEEAVQLVIQAGAVGRDGEALVLDMGEPVKIDDVAKRLIAEADRPIEIVYTGLRDGEKLHEVLFSPEEDGSRPIHPRISHVTVPPLSEANLPIAAPMARDQDVIDELRDACELIEERSSAS
ncbi:MAG: polysaccharide biosynthesis protein [Acidimicrobiales bacterium]|nr:polysaccharide biosynthesis protein [Acidimicrobiales bacterium]HRW38074.1 nucleoside-diphosphate sugar epimerase/dehydratase [Aquihabitans sp.]